VAHTTLQGIFESLHVVRQAASSSGKDARGRLNEGEVDLLRSALVLAGAGLDAVLKRLARDALPQLLAVGSTQVAADKAFKTHVSAQVRDKTPSTTWTQGNGTVQPIGPATAPAGACAHDTAVHHWSVQ